MKRLVETEKKLGNICPVRVCRMAGSRYEMVVRTDVGQAGSPFKDYGTPGLT